MQRLQMQFIHRNEILNAEGAQQNLCGFAVSAGWNFYCSKESMLLNCCSDGRRMICKKTNGISGRKFYQRGIGMNEIVLNKTGGTDIAAAVFK